MTSPPAVPAIVPTVGRKVWYYEAQWQQHPWDATIIKVFGTHPHSPCNLSVIEPDSAAQSCRRSIVVGDESTFGPHFRWLPHQLGQAKRHADEALTGSQQPQTAG